MEMTRIMHGRLDQSFFCDPVVLESICYCTRAYRLINESNTTLGLRKICTGNITLSGKFLGPPGIYVPTYIY